MEQRHHSLASIPQPLNMIIKMGSISQVDQMYLRFHFRSPILITVENKQINLKKFMNINSISKPAFKEGNFRAVLKSDHIEKKPIMIY